jgi:hypothetical protein
MRRRTYTTFSVEKMKPISLVFFSGKTKTDSQFSILQETTRRDQKIERGREIETGNNIVSVKKRSRNRFTNTINIYWRRQ